MYQTLIFFRKKRDIFRNKSIIKKMLDNIENIQNYINERNNDFQLIEDSFEILNDKISNIEIKLIGHDEHFVVINESKFNSKLLNNKVETNTNYINIIQEKLSEFSLQIENLTGHIYNM